MPKLHQVHTSSLITAWFLLYHIEVSCLFKLKAQVKDADKSEISTQDASVVKSIDMPEALEQEEEEEEEEEPLCATMNNIFAEIEKMSKTRPSSLLIEVLIRAAIFL